MTNVEHLKTINWAKTFLQWLPEGYKKNVFEAIKNSYLDLERPNITEDDANNLQLAFGILRDNWLLTPQNITSLNHIDYQKETIGIDGIIFDRNNLTWWGGIYKKETDERYYDKLTARDALKKQGKKIFGNYDFWNVMKKSRPQIWWGGLNDMDWRGMTYGLNILWTILWCKRSWYVGEWWKLENVGMGYLKLKSQIFEGENYMQTPLYYFDERAGSCTVHRFADDRYPIRPILWYDKKI